MSSSIVVLTKLLQLESPEITRFYISCFRDYADGFLHRHNPYVLDPDFAQIRARVRLKLNDRSAGWIWTKQDPQSKVKWEQEEHAAAFVLRVLDYTTPGRCSATAEEIHKVRNRLCALQSVWLGNTLWVEDWKFEGEIKQVLTIAMEEVELAPAMYPAEVPPTSYWQAVIASAAYYFGFPRSS